MAATAQEQILHATEPTQQSVLAAMQAVRDSVDGLEGFLDGVEGLLTTLGANTDGVEALLGDLKGYTDTLEAGLATLAALLARDADGNHPVTVASALVPREHDYVDLNYTGDNLTTVVYKQGGASGTTVATLTLAYDGSGRLDSVTRS